MSEPIAYLWQNGRVLEDGCFNFYSTAERADQEIREFGGWKTAVYDQEPRSNVAATEDDLWASLGQHKPGGKLVLPPDHAAAVRVFLAAEAARVGA